MSLANRKVDGMPTFLKKVSLILTELYHILILKAMLMKVAIRASQISITIVVLQLVSSQYAPRALRVFLQERVTRVVAGGFFAISTYCKVVLTTLPMSRGRAWYIGPSVIDKFSTC